MLLSSSVAAADVTSYHRWWMDYDVIFFGGILTLYALCMGYIYQLLRLPTTVFTNCYVYWLLYSSILLSSVMDTLFSSSVLPLRQMLINSAIYVGHDITLFLRRTWSLFSDSSHSLDVTTILGLVTLAGLDYYSQIRHTRRTLLLLTDYAAGHGLYLTCGVRGAASKPLTVRCRTPGC